MDLDAYIEENLKDDSDAPTRKQLATPEMINKEIANIILYSLNGT